MRLLLLSFFLGGAVLVGAEEVVVFAVGEWAPYVGASLPDYGSAARTVRAACEAAGLRPKFEFYPWLRAELRVRDGLAFGSFPYQRIPEREGNFLFSDAILRSYAVILRKNGDARTAAFKYGGKPAEFAPFIVGTTAGSEALIGPLRGAGGIVEDTPTLDQSLQKLERARIHFIVDDRAAIEDAIRRLYPGRGDLFVFLDRDFTEPRSYRLLVSKTYPGAESLLGRFNEGLAKTLSDKSN
jgi:polar amino acid transport system substrate-binding protein